MKRWLVAAALGAAGCASPSAPTPAGPSGSPPAAWAGAVLVADAGEVPLSFCGSVDPPCRRGGDDRYYPALAVNERGQAIAAWHRNDDGFRLRAARFEPGTGWSHDEPVSGEAGSYEHRLSLAADGTAAAAWNWYVPEFDGVTHSSRAGSAGSVALPGQAWSREAALGGAFDQVRALQVGADGQGLALLARECHFYDPACTWGDVLAAHVRDGAWRGYESVRRKPASPCQEISLYDRATAVAPRGGSAVAVWMEYDRGQRTYSCDDGFQRLMSSRYDGRWSAPVQIDQTATTLESLERISVAADAQGGAMVTYVKTRSFDNRGVFAQRYVPGRGWLAPELLAGQAWTPALAADRDGNALVVWWGGDRRLHARSFDARSETWTPAQEVPGTQGVGTESFAVAISGPGLGLAAWLAYDGNLPEQVTVMASLFSGGSWSEARLLQAPAHGEAVGRPALAMDPAGNALAAWAEFDGTRESIWANRFEAQTR